MEKKIDRNTDKTTPNAADQVVQGVDRFHIEQAVGLGRRAVATDGDGRAVSGKRLRQLAYKIGGGLLLDQMFRDSKPRPDDVRVKCVQCARSLTIGQRINVYPWGL